jgi:hypothetical protein
MLRYYGVVSLLPQDSDALRASVEEHRPPQTAADPPKTLPQKRIGEATHWIDDQPQSAADPPKEIAAVGCCSDQQSDFDFGNV